MEWWFFIIYNKSKSIIIKKLKYLINVIIKNKFKLNYNVGKFRNIIRKLKKIKYLIINQFNFHYIRYR